MASTDSLFRLSILGALGLSACAARPLMEEGEDDTGTGADSIADTGDADTGDADTGTPIDPGLCENPEPIMQAGTDVPSGFVRCADGFIHRPEAVACVNPHSPGSCLSPDTGFGCVADADCFDKPYGSCNTNLDFYGCSCTYGCETDADCGDGQICACAGVVGERSKCITADCPLTASCGEGLCGLELWVDICNTTHGATACTSTDSSCRTHADCPVVCDTEQLQLRCAAYLGWNCQTENDVWCGDYCGEGRPFVVGHQARTAGGCERSDWLAERELGGHESPSIAAEQLAVLARHYTRVGLFEHASVASFARFAQQLLAIGAPPALIRRTQQAALDEIEHARLAFALAARFGGRPVGPGRLAVGGALERVVDRRAVVEALIHEACVGETLAAIEADHAATCAEDPEVAEVLVRIAADELRHAELGWGALRWLLDEGDAELRDHALACFDAAFARLDAAAPEGAAPGSLDADAPDTPTLAAFGLLGVRRRAQLRREAIERVLRPCVEVLAAHVAIAADHGAPISCTNH